MRRNQIMMASSMNYWAILVAAVAYMALGALWYSPALFGNAWMRGISKTREQLAAQASPINYLWALITSFVASYGIARIMSWSGGNTIGDAIKISILAAICFVLTTMSVNDTFEGRPKGLTFINILYHIVGFIIIGIIIGAWR
jgi:hypothetical protein